MDIFVLEILVNYLESLSLAHSDDQAKGIVANLTNTFYLKDAYMCMLKPDVST